jgi:hypothetical protein
VRANALRERELVGPRAASASSPVRNGGVWPNSSGPYAIT